MQNFNYHSHTYRCRHSEQNYLDEEYVQDYIKMGFKKIAFTDHMPEKRKVDKRKTMRMDYDEKEEYYKSIETLQEKYKGQIEIEKGFEIEFLPDYVPELMELKNETDKLVLGQHFVYDDDEKEIKIVWSKAPFEDRFLEKYVNYLEEAMKLGLPDIIAHPDLFMVTTDEFGEREEKAAHKICKAAEKYNVPLEINLNGIFGKVFLKDKKLQQLSKEEQIEKIKEVSYPNRNFWKIASQYNIKVVYGLDTHYRGQIDLYLDLLDLSTRIIGEETINKLSFIGNV